MFNMEFWPVFDSWLALPFKTVLLLVGVMSVLTLLATLSGIFLRRQPRAGWGVLLLALPLMILSASALNLGKMLSMSLQLLPLDKNFAPLFAAIYNTTFYPIIFGLIPSIIYVLCGVWLLVLAANPKTTKTGK